MTVWSAWLLALFAVAPVSASLSAPTLEEAIAAFGRGDYAGALTQLEALPAEDPEVAFYRGYSLLRLHRDSEAMQPVEQVLAANPNDLRAVYLRAVLRDHLQLRGAREDFARVAAALPEAPIGKAAAEYLRAPSPASSSAEPPSSGTPAPTRPWALVPRLSVAADYDTNPAYSPGTDLAGSGAAQLGGQQLATSVAGAPAASVWGRLGLRYQASEAWQWTLGAQAFERFYWPLADASQVPLQNATGATAGAGAAPGRGGAGGGARPTSRAAGPPGSQVPQTGSAAPWQNRSYDFTEAALDARALWRGPWLQARLGYRGGVQWFGYAPFAHEHTLSARLLGPTGEVGAPAVRASLRLTGDVFVPINSSYSYLRGGGGTVEPGVSALLLGDALLLEGAYVGEVYKAADYRDASLGRFYSYSFWGHGPELSASYIAPFKLHVSLWGGVRFRRYMNDDVDPDTLGGQALRRQDIRWTAGARLSYPVHPNWELFGEAAYLDNRSNLDASAHDNRNVRRALFSLGGTWLP